MNDSLAIEDVKWDFSRDGDEFILKNAGNLKGCVWKPKIVPPICVLIYVHGLNSDIGRNANTLRDFAKRGIVSYAADHPHQGLSPGTETTISGIMKEIDCLIDKAHFEYPNLPIFLYGHSLGGLSVLYWTMETSKEITKKINEEKNNEEIPNLKTRERYNLIKGVIATGPWLATEVLPHPGFFTKLGLKILSFIPGFGINFSPKGGSHYDPGFEAANLAYMKGKTKVNHVYPITLLSVFSAQEKIRDYGKDWPKDKYLLIGQGNIDNFVYAPDNSKFAEDAILSAGVDKVKFIELDNIGHEPMKSKAREEWFKDCLDFLYTLSKEK